MRYYKKELPDVDEVVMCQVQQIAEMGAYVKLLEYDGAEGMILLSELSRRRIRSIQKLIRVGRNEVVVVLRVDKEKGELRDPNWTWARPCAHARMTLSDHGTIPLLFRLH